jgi:hypothetical protein
VPPSGSSTIEGTGVLQRQRPTAHSVIARSIGRIESGFGTSPVQARRARTVGYVGPTLGGLEGLAVIREWRLDAHAHSYDAGRWTDCLKSDM